MVRLALFFLTFLNACSLDVVAIAILWQLLFARLLHVPLLISEVLALGLSVWVIYIVDHLLDAWSRHYFWQVRSGHPNLIQIPWRHQFIARHALLFLGGIGIALFFLFEYVHTFPSYLCLGGFLLAFLVGFYLLLNAILQQLGCYLLGRELLIAVLFALGTILVPGTKFLFSLEIASRVSSHHLIEQFVLGLLGFASLCWANATLIARLERKVPLSELFSQKDALFLVLFLAGMLAGFLFLGSNLIMLALLITGILLLLVPLLAKYYGDNLASLATDWIMIFVAGVFLFIEK